MTESTEIEFNLKDKSLLNREFPLISYDMIINANTQELDELVRRLNKELSLRRNVSSITKLDHWNSSNFAKV
ncbi:Hypothetical protein HVR_LOCUS1312 [uncultured virus]|nr:Hypothetical protein HVR_LOCUS1312 [uncultured virus]